MNETSRGAVDPKKQKVPAYNDISEALNPKPFSGVGSETGDDLYRRAGEATSMFERIQDEVVQLFDQLCGGQYGRISSMGEIIGATSSFNVKMDLVTQATKSFLKDEKQAAVLRWLKLASKASQVRNKIAHGRPVSLHFVFHGQDRHGVFWAPSLFDTKKAGWPHKISAEWEFCLNGEQIWEYSSAFFLVSAMLLTVREQLAGVGEEPVPTVLDPTLM